MLLLLGTLLAVAIVVIDIATSGTLRAFARQGAALAWGSAANASVSLDASGVFKSESSLARENLSLRQRVASLLSLEQENALLREENSALRRLTNAETERVEGITVPVLSDADSSLYGTFVIGAGSEQGLLRGARVFAEGRVLLGIVSDVDERTSLVSALLAPGAEVKGLVASSTTITVSGRGSGNGIALVPRDTAVSVGDPVYYTDTRSIVGIIGAVEGTPASAQKTIYLRVPQNTFGIRFVTVLPPL